MELAGAACVFEPGTQARRDRDEGQALADGVVLLGLVDHVGPVGRVHSCHHLDAIREVVPVNLSVFDDGEEGLHCRLLGAVPLVEEEDALGRQIREGAIEQELEVVILREPVGQDAVRGSRQPPLEHLTALVVRVAVSEAQQQIRFLQQLCPRRSRWERHADVLGLHVRQEQRNHGHRIDVLDASPRERLFRLTLGGELPHDVRLADTRLTVHANACFGPAIQLDDLHRRADADTGDAELRVERL